MNPLEEKLREALRRKAVPEGFSERVLARTRELAEPPMKFWDRLSTFLARPVLRWAAIGLCLVIAGNVAYRARQERQRREGEIARIQVKQALRIASLKLNAARRKVEEINRGTPQSRL
ncbi:MAG TPA: hypothetical protein VEO19_04175 [Terriglobia bacterium]|nr:hypothetical protein [Terriglobia bacterium]